MIKTGLVLTWLFLTITGGTRQFFFSLPTIGRQVSEERIPQKQFAGYAANDFPGYDTLPPASSQELAKKDDSFSRLMAGVVNDTAILYNTYVDIVPKKDTVKKEIAAKPREKPASHPENATNKKIIQDSLLKKTMVSKKTEKEELPAKKPVQEAYIVMLSERKTKTSLRLIYLDITKNGKKDTVTMTIPFETAFLPPAHPKDSIKKATDSTARLKDTAGNLAGAEPQVSIPKTVKNNNPAGDGQEVLRQVVRDSLSADSNSARKTTLSNSNCKTQATDYDVDKLRIKMMAIDNDDDRVQTARKYFKIKCFNTIQIRALSEVFPTDEGRYKFFDAAYPFAYDYTNFPQLVNLLTGSYYINRFNAMIRQ